MPLGEFEGAVLRLIARNRNPDSHVGRANVLHQSEHSPRTSQDIDLFHDTKEALDQAVEADMALLRSSGYEVKIVTNTVTFRRAEVSREGARTKVEWVQDSAFRFFPAEPDEELGYRLNFWDAATNKVLAGVARQVIRDYVDLLHLHEQQLSLGALVWAAAGKDDGLSPAFILDELARLQRYPKQAYQEVRWTQPPDAQAMKRVWLEALERARHLVMEELLDAPYGCLFLDAGGRPVTPTAENWASFRAHCGSIRGCVPRIGE